MVGRTWPDITEAIAHQTACYPFQTLLNTKRQMPIEPKRYFGKFVALEYNLT